MLENMIEKKLRNAVESLGGRAIKFETSSCNGMPDRIVILPGGRIIFVELKRPKGGKLETLQKHQRSKLQKLGVDVRVIKNYEEVESFIEEIRCKLDAICSA